MPANEEQYRKNNDGKQVPSCSPNTIRKPGIRETERREESEQDT
jgi:hypothetical protein